MIARSADGERLTTILTLDQDHFGAQWTERPALVRTGEGRYDGRASAEENWFERTGLARPAGGRYESVSEPLADVRYLEALPLPGGGHRIYYEARLPDESHELRTELIP